MSAAKRSVCTLWERNCTTYRTSGEPYITILLLSFPCQMYCQSLDGKNLAHYMVETLHLYPPDTLAILLDCGLDFALQEPEGENTPLMYAARFGFMPGGAALLGLSALLGRDVALGFGSINPCGSNVFHLLMTGECGDGDAAANAVLELLLAHPDVDEATANARDVKGRTPLHVALLHGNIDCASTLLRSPKVFRGDADNEGCTPLHYLFEWINNNTEIGRRIASRVHGLLCKLLRWEAGGKPVIDVFATSDDGLTAFDLACELRDSFGGSSRRTLECFMHWRRGLLPEEEEEEAGL